MLIKVIINVCIGNYIRAFHYITNNTMVNNVDIIALLLVKSLNIYSHICSYKIFKRLD